MFKDKRINDTVHWYMNELSSRVVAKSGRASDRHHLGKLILQGLKDAPDFILQIDGATNESETNSSVLRRSIRCATALKKMGIGHGDTMILIAPNHLDLTIPFFAALYLGVVAAPLDMDLTVNELEGAIGRIRPKIVFCQSEKIADVLTVVKLLHLSAEKVTFDIDDHYCCDFKRFLNRHSDHSPIEDFRATDFDPDETIAMLMPTSGTTGVPKSAALSHKHLATSLVHLWSKHCEFPTPTRLYMIINPITAVTSATNYILCPIIRYTRLQSSQKVSLDHVQYLINTYKPTFAMFNPHFLATLIKRDSCSEITCFETILLSGSPVSQDFIDEIKKITPKTHIFNRFGMTELMNTAFVPENSPPTSCGKPLRCYQYKLVDIDTKQDVTGEPNTPGELWLRGPGMFKGYYKNEKATKEAFSGDWFKTGDMFYRDEQWNFFFIERLTLMLKYDGYKIAPVEIEAMIKQHPGVASVAVVGVPDKEFGEIPCACVMPRAGYSVTAQEIKNLVRKNLSNPKQLTCGVVFFKELPITSSTKIHRRKLKDIVSKLERIDILNTDDSILRTECTRS